MTSTTQIVASILLASVPAMVWSYIFYKKDPVHASKAVATFLVGMLAVIPMLAYKWSWQFFPQINVFNYTNTLQADVLHFSPLLVLPVGSILAFMFVGVIEEYLKHRVVVQVDRGFFRNIDDAIEFSIIAALGFAFIENVLYFYYIWEFQGTDTVLISFVFRSLFSTFAHVLFSGIYGYFYGLAYFADPIWAEKNREKRHPFLNTLHKFTHFKKSRVFQAEKLTEGLLLATVLHAIFNILLEMNVTFFMIPFLLIGYNYLNHLFHKKENLKYYGFLAGSDSPAHFHNKLWERLKRSQKSKA